MHVLDVFGIDENGNKVAGTSCVVGPASIEDLAKWAEDNGFQRAGAEVWKRESPCFLHKTEVISCSPMADKMFAKAERVYNVSVVVVSESSKM